MPERAEEGARGECQRAGVEENQEHHPPRGEERQPVEEVEEEEFETGEHKGRIMK